MNSALSLYKLCSPLWIKVQDVRYDPSWEAGGSEQRGQTTVYHRTSSQPPSVWTLSSRRAQAEHTAPLMGAWRRQKHQTLSVGLCAAAVVWTHFVCFEEVLVAVRDRLAWSFLVWSNLVPPRTTLVLISFVEFMIKLYSLKVPWDDKVLFCAV